MPFISRHHKGKELCTGGGGGGAWGGWVWMRIGQLRVCLSLSHRAPPTRAKEKVGSILPVSFPALGTT